MERNFKKAKGWTLALAIVSTVFGAFSLMSVLMVIFVIQDVFNLVEFVVWSLFYSTMAITFYRYCARLKEHDSVSQIPYKLWIGFQLGNIVWNAILLLLGVRPRGLEIIIVLPIIYSVVMSALAIFPLIYLNKNKKEQSSIC